MELKKVGFSHVPVTESQNKSFDFNRLTFINKGSTTANISSGGYQYPLAPGESITYPAWPGEICHTVFNIVFPTGVNGNNVVAIVKTYV